MIDKLSDWSIHFDVISAIFFGEPDFPMPEDETTEE